MTRAFDLAVVGSGVAARSVATAMASEGWSVAVIDRKPLGGTCMLRGCDPKRVLIGVAAAVRQATRLNGFGVSGVPRISWGELMRFKRSFTDPVPEQQEESYAKAGIAVLRGTARFTGPTTLDVDGERVEARHILIATGAHPVPLGIPGEEHLATHDAFMERDELPARVVFVGGGYIAAELSALAACAGAEVTVLERGPRMLKRFDAELVAQLTACFAGIGVDLRTGAEVASIARAGAGFAVTFRHDGSEETIEADMVVHAAGRVPDLADLEPEAGGLAVSNGRLELDGCLRSTANPAVFAAGDVAGKGPPLTPVASLDAEAVVANLKGGAQQPDYSTVPSVAFTLPPIAAVGLGAEEATEKGLDVRISAQDASGWFTAGHLREPVYGFRMVIERGTDRLLGAHVVGPRAEETINLLALAIRKGMTTADLKGLVYAYPTAASDLPSML